MGRYTENDEVILIILQAKIDSEQQFKEFRRSLYQKRL